MFNQNAMSNLKNKYSAVLKKCHLLNTFGSLAVAGLLCVSAVGVDVAWAANITGSTTVKDLTANDTGSIAVSGNLTIQDATNSSATYTVTGDTNYVSGTLTLDGYTTLNIKDGNTLLVVGSADYTGVNDAINEAQLNKSSFATLAVDGTHHAQGTGALNVGSGSASINSGSTVAFDNSSLFVVNATNLGTSCALTAHQIDVSSGAKLLVSNVDFTNATNNTVTLKIAEATNTYGTSLTIESGAWGYDGTGINLITGDITASGNYTTITAAKAKNLYFDNAFTSGTVDFTYNSINGSGGSYVLTLTQVEANTVLPLLDEELAEHIDDAKGRLPDYIDKASKIDDKTEAASTIESAAKMSVGAGVLASLSAVNELGASAVANRSNLVASTNTNKATISQLPIMLADSSTSFTDVPVPLIADAATGNGLVDGFALWVQPLYQSVSADGFKSGNFDYGYNTDIFGVSLGADYTMDACWRFGLAFHMGDGDTESDNSDLSYTKNDFDYYGATLYSAYVLDNLSLSADIGYITTINDVVQQSSIGVLSTGDFNAGAFSVGARAQYKVATSFVDIVPYLGARLNYSHIDSFDTKDANGVVFHNESAEATTFGIPVGVTFAKTLEFEDFTLTPRAKVGVQFTMGDLDVEQRVSLPNVSGHATMESEVFDPITFMSGVGLDFGFDNVNLALEYNLGASENVLSQQVMATFSYKF